MCGRWRLWQGTIREIRWFTSVANFWQLIEIVVVQVHVLIVEEEQLPGKGARVLLLLLQLLLCLLWMRWLVVVEVLLVVVVLLLLGEYEIRILGLPKCSSSSH